MKKTHQLPSRYTIDDYVNLQFLPDQKPMLCQVTAVHFTISKVKYDLGIILNEELGLNQSEEPVEYTRIYNVDSYFVNDIEPEE